MNLQILESYIISSFVKNLANYSAQRPRPLQGYDAHTWRVKNTNSFFSGHSSNLFQIATILSHHVDYKPFSVLAYGIAGTVALQRIDAEKHWLSDVFVGSVFGYAIAKGIIFLNEKRENNFELSVAKFNYTYALGINYRF